MNVRFNNKMFKVDISQRQKKKGSNTVEPMIRKINTKQFNFGLGESIADKNGAAKSGRKCVFVGLIEYFF